MADVNVSYLICILPNGADFQLNPGSFFKVLLYLLFDLPFFCMHVVKSFPNLRQSRQVIKLLELFKYVRVHQTHGCDFEEKSYTKATNCISQPFLLEKVIFQSTPACGTHCVMLKRLRLISLLQAKQRHTSSHLQTYLPSASASRYLVHRYAAVVELSC